jgi:hypothetical protein
MAANQGDRDQERQHGNPQQGLAGERQTQQRQGQGQRQGESHTPNTPTDHDRTVGRQPGDQAREDEGAGGPNARDQQQGDDR